MSRCHQTDDPFAEPVIDLLSDEEWSAIRKKVRDLSDSARPIFEEINFLSQGQECGALA
jgi:hypothetical protein